MSFSTIGLSSFPDKYGYVVLSTVVGHFATNMVLSAGVMKARKEFDVQYPNLYAVPGYHKKADEFNRVQRGHQNVLEGMSFVVIMSLICGIRYPVVTSVLNAAHCVGCVLYQKGYADTKLDVKTARYKKGGPLKPLSELALLVLTIRVAYVMIAK